MITNATIERYTMGSLNSDEAAVYLSEFRGSRYPNFLSFCSDNEALGSKYMSQNSKMAFSQLIFEQVLGLRYPNFLSFLSDNETLLRSNCLDKFVQITNL